LKSLDARRTSAGSCFIPASGSPKPPKRFRVSVYPNFRMSDPERQVDLGPAERSIWINRCCESFELGEGSAGARTRGIFTALAVVRGLVRRPARIGHGSGGHPELWQHPRLNHEPAREDEDEPEELHDSIPLAKCSRSAPGAPGRGSRGAIRNVLRSWLDGKGIPSQRPNSAPAKKLRVAAGKKSSPSPLST